MHLAEPEVVDEAQVDLGKIDPMEIPRKQTIAYLTSQYARAGDPFVRGEVDQLRKLGFTVHTFSIRAPRSDEVVSEAVRRERTATEDLLGGSKLRLLTSTLVMLLSHPIRFMRAFKLARKVSSPGLRGQLWPIAYLVEASLLARRLKAKGVTHLHNHIGRNSAAVAMLASTLADIPYSLTIHGPTEFDMAQTLALDVKIAHATFTVGISNFGRSQLMRFSKTKDWPRIHIVHCGLANEFVSATPTPVPDVPKFVCVARFVEQKAHLLLVEAVAQLVKEGSNIQVDLIGGGPLKPAIEAAITKHRVQDHVHLVGWKNAAEVRSAIEASRAMVLPSFAEGLPVSLMEAMALARPVVCTTVGAIPELIENQKHGWLVSPGDIDSLASALREALETPVHQVTEMGRAGRERVLERHDAACEAKKLATLILNAQSPANSQSQDFKS